MPRIVVILVALAAASPLNAVAQTPTAPVVSIPSGGLAKCEPATCLSAPTPQSNCEKGGGKWDKDKRLPTSQIDDDLRCDLSAKNAGKDAPLGTVAFCNDPDDKSALRQVYGEWQCVAWKARRADRARIEARLKKAIEGIPPVDLKPIEARIGAGEIETARVEGEVTKLSEKLTEETTRLDGEIEKLSDQLARSPECTELAEKGAALLAETAADGTKTGLIKFEACLADPKTDPAARTAILGVRVAQAKAEEALAKAEEALKVAAEAKASAAKALHIGLAYSLGFTVTQPSLIQGTNVVRRGSNGFSPFGFAVLLHAEQLHVDLTFQLPLIEQLRDAAGVTSTAYGVGGSLRANYVWNPEGWPTWLLVGPALSARVQGSNFLSTAPIVSAFAYGAGLGARVEVAPAGSSFRLALDLDPLAWDWVSGTVDNKSIKTNGYVFPVAVKAGFVF